MAATRDPRTIYFYRQSHPNGFLSNFYPSPILLTGISYKTVEHFFQALKSGDGADHKYVAEAPTPAEAKRRGRLVPLREDWQEVKDAVMLAGLAAKFSNQRLGKALLATGSAKLVERTDCDAYWGDGRSGTGKNRLGSLLSAVRAALRAAFRAAVTEGEPIFEVPAASLFLESIGILRGLGDEHFHDAPSDFLDFLHSHLLDSITIRP